MFTLWASPTPRATCCSSLLPFLPQLPRFHTKPVPFHSNLSSFHTLTKVDATMEDYELRNAREWDTNYKKPTPQEPPRRRRRSNNSPRRQIPCIIIDGDNDGAAAWRSHAKPTDCVSIPTHLVLQDRWYETTAQNHGTFIYNQDSSDLPGFRTFDIWGEIAAVEATKQEIERWIVNATSGRKSASSAKWAKQVSSYIIHLPELCSSMLTLQMIGQSNTKTKRAGGAKMGKGCCQRKVPSASSPRHGISCHR